MGSVVVVFGDEVVDQGLELADGGWLGVLGGEPFLHGLLEAFDFALGGGVVGAAVIRPGSGGGFDSSKGCIPCLPLGSTQTS